MDEEGERVKGRRKKKKKEEGKKRKKKEEGNMRVYVRVEC